jgi:uncharacterized repeat protein (TIGR02543 family)
MCDVFVTKLNPAGSALVYSTYLGGSDGDWGQGIAVDSSGSAYITGFTWSTNFPTVNPIQGTFSGGADAFVTKLNPAGSALVYSTYLGGTGGDGGEGIAVDGSGSAYITGFSESTNFPTASPIQGTNAGGHDVFVTKLNPAGSALVYSTYLGGSGDDWGQGIAVDGSGSAYITGYTSSTNFPTANPIQGTYAGGNWDAFIARLEISAETISIPTRPNGPTTGNTGVSYLYQTGSSSSDLGHSVEYQFDWKGDGSDLSSWGSGTQSKTWATPGTYAVRTRARCTIDTSEISPWSGTLSVTITVPEAVSTPTTLSGPTSGITGTSYTYSTGGSSSNLDHPVEYQFDWNGDGSDLSPWGAPAQSKTWANAGAYNVRARARCATDTDVISSWSGSLSVTITVPSTVATNPSGLQIMVDGSTYTAPHTFDWTPNSSHNLSVSSPQSGTSGTRYVYSSWSDGETQTHTISGPSSSTTYTASFTTQYSLTTSVNPSGAGTITPSGTNWYDSGQNVFLFATANPGYTFGAWSGDFLGTTNPTSINMDGPKNVVANFTQNQYTLAVNIAPTGSGLITKVPDKTTYVYGDVVTLTATANAGYTFSNWSGDATGSTNPVTMTINGNKNVTANFTQNQYTLTVNIAPSGSGSVTKSPDKASYIYGEQVTLTATANSGYTFDKWSGDVSGATNPITLTVNGNKTATANFARIPETVSTPTTPSGPSSGTIGAPYSYTTGGSTSSYDHPMEYQFDWKGNGTDLSPWGAATQSKIWTAAGTYKVKARARCTLDTSVISGWSGSIKVVIALNRSTRTLPHSYTPSLPLTVAIAINPRATTQAYSAEDSPPSGWTVSNINEYGQWDDVNKKVKWGIFFDSNFRTLTYQVTPPIGETAVKSFSGQASFDGVNEVIGGDSMIELGALLHPADTSLNFELSISEVTAYAAAWRSGQTWPVPPNPIPIEYTSNAGYLWRNGEEYHYDATRIPPSCWVPGAATEGLSVKRSLPFKSQASLEGQVALNAGAATRDLPNCYTPSVVMPVSSTVAPGQGTQAHAVEDSPPAGWTVSDINENGGWDDVKKKVKWGPFFDSNSRTLTYKVTPPSDETGIKTFSGTASFDGMNMTIGGDLNLGVCTTSPITLNTPANNSYFDACFLYSTPVFSWNVEEGFKSYEVQFDSEDSFTSPVKVKVPGNTLELFMKPNTWKKILLIARDSGGSVYWRVAAKRPDNSVEMSGVRSIILEPVQPVENLNISSTSESGPPTLSWETNCNIKFKARFGRDEGFTKKTALTFNIKNPNDNGGIFTKLLTKGQWRAIRRVVGDTPGSTIYWYVESWDGLGRYAKTGVMSFFLTD